MLKGRAVEKDRRIEDSLNYQAPGKFLGGLETGERRERGRQLEQENDGISHR